MTWKIANSKLNQEQLLTYESILSIANGYLGVRGNFEEGYPESFKTIRGTYINAFYDYSDVQYGEKFHAYPDSSQTLVNVMDAQFVSIIIDNELFSLFEGEVLGFQYQLHLDKGYSERIVHWKSPNGKEVKINFKRITSFVTKELFGMNITIDPISAVGEIKIISRINGNVENYADKDDPRVASEAMKHLEIIELRKEDDCSIIQNRTVNSNLEVACVSTSSLSTKNYSYSCEVKEDFIEEVYTCEGTGPIQFTKLNVYTDSLRHKESIVSKGIDIQKEIGSFDELLQSQKAYLDQFWKQADVKIEGDPQLQEGIRFNLFHLLQSVGKDPISNIAAKGLSGEGYEGHYFWDTEIYSFPVFLLTQPKIAKNLLLTRYNMLDAARQRAKDLGHQKGALFPWRTITGPESSTYYPAGTAQYHISADIAYSYIQYYLVTKDKAFLKNYMAEVLFETARLWLEVGHMLNGQFRIDDVTGPDEYTCIVNNNYYTNSMAKNNLLWAGKIHCWLERNDQELLTNLKKKINLTDDEVKRWLEAGQAMYLPYDEELGINAQDDSFLSKKVWDFENTPKENYPLLLNYHPLTLYRHQVCKQADTVLSHFLLEDEQELDTIKNSYDYYEKITTHDSSLSYCIFSIMGSKLGYSEKAYNYFDKTARLDLDNTHGNTKDGLHMANMAGTWLAIVYGFAGLRVKEDGLYLHPQLPEKWESLSFNFQYLGKAINILMEKGSIKYRFDEQDYLEVPTNTQKIRFFKQDQENKIVVEFD